MSFSVSINPTYFCNFRCPFCYLTKEQLSDNATLLDLKILENRLIEINQHVPLTHVDVYGGEVGLLLKGYSKKLYDTIRQQYNGNINIITNLSVIDPEFLRDDITVSVSYDFDCREKHELVLRNIAAFPKDVHVLLLASECLIQKDVDDMIRVLNSISNIKSVEIKPYSSNQSNQYSVTFKQHEQFIIKWVESLITKRFHFVNEDLIKQSLFKERNAFSDDHVYITPHGKFGVLEFDLNDHEYFLEYETFGEYLKWTEREKHRVSGNKFCKNCSYYGHCLSEHLRTVINIDNSCNGYKLLLDWYDKRI